MEKVNTLVAPVYSLPLEILHMIGGLIEDPDLVNFTKTCKAINSAFSGSEDFWKRRYNDSQLVCSEAEADFLKLGKKWVNSFVSCEEKYKKLIYVVKMMPVLNRAFVPPFITRE